MLIVDFPGTDGPAAPGTPDAIDGRGSRRLVFDDPIDLLIARTEAEVRPVLRAVEAATRHGLHAAGFVSYEAAPAFDPAHVAIPDRNANPSGSLPLAWFGLYREPAIVPGARGRADDAAPHARGALPHGRSEPRNDTARIEKAVPLLRAAIAREAYDAGVARIRAAIADGDVYQVNYTFPLSADISPDDARDLYESLAGEGHGGYGAYLDIGSHRLLSFSPELFFARVGDRVTCRPMKGTVARGRWPEEDAARARWLQSSEKNRAENVMIVDLVRNDLGRVAQIGSVRASSVCALERYPTVWQMTSTVDADLRPGTALDDLFAALFPCGSVTGAPKISAMRQIAELEASPRGVYCGAIGLVGPDRATFNVAIRTMTIDVARGVAEYRVGGGVTWDSHSREEYAEALAKAALLRPAPVFSLLETMRLEDGRLVRIERHLARLAASAGYFDMPIDVARIRARLDECAAARPDGVWRVRLLVSRRDASAGDIDDHESAIAPLRDDAGIKIEVTELPRRDTMIDAPPAIVALASTPVDADDVFLHHKTTNRQVYAARRAEAPDLFDVLLWNTRGEVTEFTIGNIVVSLDGRRSTPPQSSGLLAGTFRAELIESGAIEERILTREDVMRADAIWLINGVREWVPVVLQAPVR